MPGLLDGSRWVATNLFDPLGQVFLRMLFFVVIPLVFASLAGGVVQLGDLSDLGPLAGRTFALFFVNMAIAATLGLLMMNLLNPGGRLDEATSARLVQEYSGQAAVSTSQTQRVARRRSRRPPSSTCSCRATCSARSSATSATCWATCCR